VIHNLHIDETLEFIMVFIIRADDVVRLHGCCNHDVCWCVCVCVTVYETVSPTAVFTFRNI